MGTLSPETGHFSHIKDMISMGCLGPTPIVTIAESNQTVGEVINIDSNYEISIGDTVEMIAEIMNVKINIESDTQRIRPENSEAERLWADNSKAKKLTDWAPAYGGVEGLKRGLQETVTWFTKAENLRQYKPDEYNI